MEPDFVLHDLSPNHVVFELHERLTWPGRGLEMHLLLPADELGAISWWQDDQGEYCRMLELARA